MAPFDEEELAKLSLVSILALYLRKHHPGDVLVPVGGETGKSPIVKHAMPASWTAFESERWRRSHPRHTEYAILASTLCVIDVDSEAVAHALQERFPILASVPCERTRKGMHYFFKRSTLADEDGYYDARAPVCPGIDFKSRTARRSRGVVVVAPSTGKSWIRAPWDCEGGIPIIPDDLLQAVATARHPARDLTFECKDRELVECTATRHTAPGSPYVSMFVDGGLDGTSPGTIMCHAFTAAAVKTAVAIVETREVPSNICTHVRDEAFAFCDFAGIAPERVASVRDRCEEIDAIKLVHPAMAEALNQTGTVDVCTQAPVTTCDNSIQLGPCEVTLSKCAGVAPAPAPLVQDPAAAVAHAIEPAALEWMHRFPGKVVCAGGRVTGAVCATVSAGSDTDLFVITEDVAEADYILDYVRSDRRVRRGRFTGYAYSMIVSDTSYTDDVSGTPPQDAIVQLVLTLNRDCETLIRGFDYAPSKCAAYIDPESGQITIKSTPDWLASIRAMAFPIPKAAWTESSILRLVKYVDVKGFRAYLPGLDRSKVDDPLMSHSSKARLNLGSGNIMSGRNGTAWRDTLMQGRGLRALFVCERFVKDARVSHLDCRRGHTFKRVMGCTQSLRSTDYDVFENVMGSTRGVFTLLASTLLYWASTWPLYRPSSRRQWDRSAFVIDELAPWRVFLPVARWEVRASRTIDEDFGAWRKGGTSIS